MANFKFALTEHSICRFKQRVKEYLKTDNFDIYIILQKEQQHANLTYISPNKKTHYYELPNYEGYYFVVTAFDHVCTTILKLNHKKILELDYPTSNDY